MRTLFVIFIMCIYSLLWSQDVEKKVVVKKTDKKSENVWVSEDGAKKEKIVTVDVQQSGENERTVKIVTNENGEDKVIEWTDNGEIPSDIKEKLIKEGIDINMMSDGDDMGKEMEIIVHRGGDEDYEFEWNGEGEIPMKMKELMEEHDIDIEEYMDEKDHDGEKKIIIKKIKGSKGDHIKDHKMLKSEKKYRMVTIDDEGNDSVIEWVGDDKEDGRAMVFINGDRSDRSPRHMRFDRDGGHEMMFFGDGEKRKETKVSDAYMGVQIESADMGVAVLELMKDGPADKASLAKGDIIQRINGARTKTMEDLLGLLGYFEPNDKVELTVIRTGKEKKLNLVLGKRPDHFR